MIARKTLAELLASNPVADLQDAIAAMMKDRIQGVSVVKHPGKVDLSELVAKTVVTAPGIGLGWSQVRYAGAADGSFGMLVNWTAYIAAEARTIADRRVEKEAIGIAIGSQILKILGDDEASFWNRTGVLPVEDKPAAELKPIFTVRDASQGVAYYVVTWWQIIADVGETTFPTAKATGGDADQARIDYDDPADLDAISKFFPARREPDDA